MRDGARASNGACDRGDVRGRERAYLIQPPKMGESGPSPPEGGRAIYRDVQMEVERGICARHGVGDHSRWGPPTADPPRRGPAPPSTCPRPMEL